MTKYFSDAFEVLSTTPIDQDQLNILLSASVEHLSFQIIDGWIDQWVQQHDSTQTSIYRRWHNQHASVSTTTSWTTCSASIFGEIVASLMEMLDISANGFSEWDFQSDSWTTISDVLPSLSSRCVDYGIVTGLSSKETVTKIQNLRLESPTVSSLIHY